VSGRPGPAAGGSVSVRVPAKINLQLGVGPRRDDGFHDLVTVYQAVDLHDTVTAAHGPGLTAEIHGEQAELVPTDSTNLAVRAAALLAERTGVDAAAHLTIEKSIPVAGGMAGGSADAAAALVACDALWHTALSRDALAELAAELGSDVPFLLYGGTALGTGRGEKINPVLGGGTFHWVIAVADGGLSTPEVYRRYDELGTGTWADDPDAVLAAVRAGDAAALATALVNDLEAPAVDLRPELGAVLEAGRSLNALAAMVSGSGPTVLFLARDALDAGTLSDGIGAAGVCRGTRVATGPVPGARVVAA
jgi:4-diphosphocytidyl-2-C-methyl-D-erythritol kinase